MNERCDVGGVCMCVSMCVEGRGHSVLYSVREFNMQDKIMALWE